MIVTREYDLPVFWKLLIGVRDAEINFYKYDEEHSEYSCTVPFGKIVLKAGTTVIVEEDPESGDVIFGNGLYSIPWVHIEDAEAYGLLKFDYVIDVTKADDLEALREI